MHLCLLLLTCAEVNPILQQLNNLDVSPTRAWITKEDEWVGLAEGCVQDCEPYKVNVSQDPERIVLIQSIHLLPPLIEAAAVHQWHQREPAAGVCCLLPYMAVWIFQLPTTVHRPAALLWSLFSFKWHCTATQERQGVTKKQTPTGYNSRLLLGRLWFESSPRLHIHL